MERTCASFNGPGVSEGSHLNLAYVSTQLGHSDVAVTARHYAKWLGGAGYRVPAIPTPGEVPADLLARLDESPALPPLALATGTTKR